MASSSNVRRFVLTASIAAITATGAWYGAGLKTRQEFKQVREVTIAVRENGLLMDDYRRGKRRHKRHRQREPNNWKR